MLTTPSLPTASETLSLYENETGDRLRTHVLHNHRFWRRIHGSLGMVRAHPHFFDPVTDYWYMTERRALVAYFSDYFERAYAPAPALRSLALKVFQHFDSERQHGRLPFHDTKSGRGPDWKTFTSTFRSLARDLPDWQEYASLRSNWSRRLSEPSIRDSILAFVEDAATRDGVAEVEPSFSQRLPWFPYLGLRHLRELGSRQRFFFAYYLMFASTNAYFRGGSMSFAPVLQNNPVEELVGFVEQWAKGIPPHSTGFDVQGKDGRSDKSGHTPVIELYCFLNLQMMPYYNSAASEAYDPFQLPEDAGVVDRLRRIGEITRADLREHPQLVSALSTKFLDHFQLADRELPLVMEGVGSLRLAKATAGVEGPVDDLLIDELSQLSLAHANRLPEFDRAAIMAHLLLDSAIYSPSPTYTNSAPSSSLHPGLIGLDIPDGLVAPANNALGYLRAGYHVVFAGSPGTGKTTAAQFVADAWNRGLEHVAARLPDERPLTVVANSAWAPFHTIGGIVPDQEGRFRKSRGIFIDPASESSREWRLRSSCIVLDEMNRADLDRCIGELYPLLSRSVDSVAPAGIPGIDAIRLDPRFRIVATINDATLDDIVFPISEGLARRFIRIELPGALEEDLLAFLSATAADQARLEAAREALTLLLERLREHKNFDSPSKEFRLPLGVGYFGALRSWVMGELRLSREFEELELTEQAARVIQASLTSAAKYRGLAVVAKALTS